MSAVEISPLDDSPEMPPMPGAPGDIIMMAGVLVEWDSQSPELKDEVKSTELYKAMAPYAGSAALKTETYYGFSPRLVTDEPRA